jgi:hypothetical protein
LGGSSSKGPAFVKELVNISIVLYTIDWKLQLPPNRGRDKDFGTVQGDSDGFA